MVLITSSNYILTWIYKPTNITGGAHIVETLVQQLSSGVCHSIFGGPMGEMYLFPGDITDDHWHPVPSTGAKFSILKLLLVAALEHEWIIFPSSWAFHNPN